MRRFFDPLWRLYEFVSRQKELSNPRFALPLLLGGTSGLYLIHHVTELRGSQADGSSLWLALATVALLTSALALFWAVYVNRDSIFSKSVLPEPEALQGKTERLRVIPIRNEETLRSVQRDLVHEIFGNATPSDQAVLEMFKKNNRKSVGLFSDDEHEFVGFATIWPLTEKAAGDIRDGVRDEISITADDLLPPEENFSARFCLIAAIGVKSPETKRGKLRAVKLVRGFKRFFLKEYVVSSSGSSGTKTLMAVAEPDGEKWCKYIGMKCEGIVRSIYGNRPLYVRDFTVDEIEDALDQLIG